MRARDGCGRGLPPTRLRQSRAGERFSDAVAAQLFRNERVLDKELVGTAPITDIGRRNTRETGLAKWFATVASERAAGDAVQVHGANGYSDEYPVGRFYRNCKGAVIYEGTREIHKIMQADYVLGLRHDKATRCELPPYGG